MYIINEILSKKRLYIRFSDGEIDAFDDICFLCLNKSGKIVNESDFVYYNSNCRSDGASIIPFDKNRFKSISEWRKRTLPTSEDNAICVLNDYGGIEFNGVGSLLLSNLREEIEEILVLCSGDKYNVFANNWWQQKDGEILRLYEQIGIPQPKPMIFLELLQVEKTTTTLYREVINIKPTSKMDEMYIGAKLASIKRGENSSFILENPNEIELVSLMDLIDDYI